MKNFLENIKALAAKNPARIVFPESGDERVIKAAEILSSEGLATAILLGNHLEHPLFKEYTLKYAALRDISEIEANAEMQNPHAFATMLVHEGEADAMIGGPTAKARERIITALKILRQDKNTNVSGCFIMLLPEHVNRDAANGGIILFADCAVTIDPSSEELAQIAIQSAQTAKHFGLNPKVALLSFSTESGAQDERTLKIIQAAEIVRARRPDIEISNDMQVDAALMDEIGARKAANSSIAGHANVLIFPNLESGNIAYKLTERLAGAKAIGPILQGLRKPINEVSRGANTDDIVNLAAITSLQVSFQ